MRFEHSQILWFLLLAPPLLVAFFWWALNSRQKLLAKFIEARLLTSLTVGVSNTRRKIRFALIILVVELLIIAIARPQHGFDLQEVEQHGLDVVVAVDTSKSMLATDITPSRLERAKLAALDLMQKDKDDRLGLVAFAGEGFLECPLTVDNTVFASCVQELNVNSIPEGGSAIASAIEAAMTAFHDGGHQKVLVLMTDGEDNAEGALEAAQNAAKAGLKIFTIGIGTSEGTLVQVTDANGNTDYIRDEKGQVLKSKLNEPLLQQIAAAGGGFYLPLRGANTMDTLYDRGLSVLPKTLGKERSLRRYHDQFQWFLIAAILLLLVEMFFPERKRERRASATRSASPMPPPIPPQALAGLLVMIALIGFTNRSWASPQSALRQYQSGNFTNAMTEYERLADISTNDYRLVFNAGTAAYRATNFDEAARLFTEATLSSDLKIQQQAYYNLGNTKYRASQKVEDLDELQTAWEQVTNIYAHAVDLDKKDPDAAYNLTFTMEQVERLKELKEYLRSMKNSADDSVRRAQYHRALGIMMQLSQNANSKVVAKQFEDYTKKLKDIDAIVTPQTSPAPAQPQP
jgi:Ca-activated chloride channel homolog